MRDKLHGAAAFNVSTFYSCVNYCVRTVCFSFSQILSSESFRFCGTVWIC